MEVSGACGGERLDLFLFFCDWCRTCRHLSGSVGPGIFLTSVVLYFRSEDGNDVAG